ncbi:hypothetical protein [uncultured Rhodoferax sp.]|uniref:hypothetical protein n=1 Tax=uncultured Rhodoferax sp. TaxID=223188 RepID=UPI0025EF24A5|nr:hypothetical protein [uncultured Rhodoferax sp.]
MPLPAAQLPRRFWALLALYFIASLTHFAHNAEFIAIYPNLPVWMTRESVYKAWLVVCVPGVLGVALRSMGWLRSGAVLLAVYGALGLAGLLHYTLALCGEHTLTTNLTIWFEVLTGAVLALVSLCTALRTRRI